MIGKYFDKSDIIDVKRSNTAMNVIDPKITTEIMSGVTDRKSLILAIEQYNEDHKLPYNKRVKYSVAVSNNYIAVLKAYTISENEIAIIGWDQTGYPTFEYNKDGIATKAMSSVSTHVVNVDNINDVMIGSYDTSKIGHVFDYETIDEISEKELNSKLTKLLNDITVLLSTGQYRTAIVKFNCEFATNKYNDYTYEFKRTAYDTYIKVFTKYILAIKEIVMDSLNTGRVKFDPVSPRIKNKFEFVESLDGIKDNALLQKIFSNEELETFKKIIDLDHLRIGPDGKAFWIPE